MSRRKDTSSSVGTRLKRARHLQHRTLKEASRALHIPLVQLQALEADTFAGAFAAPVYAYGALRAYAAWLGLDTKLLERLLAAQLKAARVSRSQLKVHTLPPWYERLIHPRLFIAASLVLVAGSIGSYIFWHIQSFWRLPRLVITSPAESIVREVG
jgi:cytoskeletal protein RodZ